MQKQQRVAWARSYGSAGMVRTIPVQMDKIWTKFCVQSCPTSQLHPVVPCSWFYCLRWKIEFETHCIRKCRQNLFDPVKVQIRVSCISVSVIGVYKKVHWKWDWQCKILWGGKKVKQFNSGRKCVTYLNNFGLGADFFGEIGSLENLSFPNLEIGDCNNCCELAEYFFFNPENTFFWRKMHIVLLI